MSARAAARLESLGFKDVYHYAGGKIDWAENGGPIEGLRASRPVTGDAARTDVPTCRIEETLAAVRDRVETSSWHQCVVVDAQGVVIGELALGSPPDPPDPPGARVGDLMREAPVTYRPGVWLDDVVGQMRERRLDSVVITTADGRHVGLLRRADGEASLATREADRTAS